MFFQRKQSQKENGFHFSRKSEINFLDDLFVNAFTGKYLSQTHTRTV